LFVVLNFVCSVSVSLQNELFCISRPLNFNSNQSSCVNSLRRLGHRLCRCEGMLQRLVVPGDGEAATSIASPAGASQHQHAGSVLGCRADGRRVSAAADEVRHASGHCHLSVGSVAASSTGASSNCHCSDHSTETGGCACSRFDLYLSSTAIPTYSATASLSIQWPSFSGESG